MQTTRTDADIETYLQHLQNQRHFSIHTIVNYRRDLSELAAFAAALDEPLPLFSLTSTHIRKFAAQLHAKGLSARSIARKLSAWRSFFNWLTEQIDRKSSEQTVLANNLSNNLADHLANKLTNRLVSNPAQAVKAPKRAKTLPKALSVDDALQLVSTSAHGAPESTRQYCDKAMFELLYSSGLRVSELVNLDVRYIQENNYVSSGWIDFDAAEVTVTGKGNKMRKTPVGQPALQAIAAWLAVRSTLVKQQPYPLFLTERGTRMSVRVVQLRLAAHARALALPQHVHPHMLRHSFASHVLQSSGDLRAVQEMLGHASIAATQIYTALDFQHLAHVYDAAHPRAKKQQR